MMTNLRTGKPFTRRDFGKGLAAILAAGVAPSLARGAVAGLRRGVGARTAAWSGKILPYDYAIEYVESSGTQWINTGICPTATMHAEVGVEPLSLDGRSRGLLANSRNGYGQSWGINAYTGAFWPSSDGGNYRDKGISTGTKYLLEFGDDYSRDGVLKASGLVTSSYKTGRVPLGLFACYPVDESGNTIILSARIYSLKITDGDETLADYVPCVKDGVVCFYDKATQAPKYNAGTDDFIAGPRI